MKNPREGHRFLSSYEPGSPEHKGAMHLVQRQIRERDTLGPYLEKAELSTEDYVDLVERYGREAVLRAIDDYGRDFRVGLGDDVPLVYPLNE